MILHAIVNDLQVARAAINGGATHVQLRLKNLSTADLILQGRPFRDLCASSGVTFVVNDDITKSTPEKSLLSPKRRSNGRNVYGRITVRHRGGGHKRMLRDIDFRREKLGIPATVKAIEYDQRRLAA